MTTSAHMPVWNYCCNATNVGGQPNLHGLFHGRSRLNAQLPLFDQLRRCINPDTVHIFHALAGHKYYVNCTALETALRIRLDKIYNMFEETGEHDFGQHLSCYIGNGDVTNGATFRAVYLLLVCMDNVGVFQLLLQTHCGPAAKKDFATFCLKHTHHA